MYLVCIDICEAAERAHQSVQVLHLAQRVEAHLVDVVEDHTNDRVGF